MRFADLVSLYFELSNVLQIYWTLYVVVIGGLLAVAALRRDPDAVAGILATVLYCAFAFKNLGAIQDATVTRVATLQAIYQFDPKSAAASEGNAVRLFQQQIEPTLQPVTTEGVSTFHIACDAITLTTMWALQWRRLRAERARGGRAGSVAGQP